jgi:predicted nuclease with TOPRIM domain
MIATAEKEKLNQQLLDREKEMERMKARMKELERHLNTSEPVAMLMDESSETKKSPKKILEHQDEIEEEISLPTNPFIISTVPESNPKSEKEIYKTHYELIEENVPEPGAPRLHPYTIPLCKYFKINSYIY